MRLSLSTNPQFSRRLVALCVLATAVALTGFAASAQAAWQTGGQLASGSLTAGSPFQSSSAVTNQVISRDGHYEFFVSRSSALSPSAPDGGIFRKNLWNDSAPLEVVAAQPAGVTNANCGIPVAQGAFISPSANGRFVAFSSSEDNLVAGDTNGRRDVFVRDMSVAVGSGAFELVSAADGSSSAPSYSLTDLGGGTDIPVPAADNCTFGSELPGPNSISGDGRKVIFSNTAFTTISSPQGVNTAPGNIWFRNTGSSRKTELVTQVAIKHDWKLGTLANPQVSIGGPLPDQEYFDSDGFSMVRFKPLASISGDGSAVVWGGPFARYQVGYNTGESASFAPGSFQAVNYMYRRIADGATAKTRRALSWADVDDVNCDPNLSFSYNADPDPGSTSTYYKRSACIGPFASDQITPGDLRVPAITDDGRTVFALAGMPGHNLAQFLTTYPLDLIQSDMSPGISRKAGTKWITRGTSTALEQIEQFAISGDGGRAAILTARRDFSSTGLVPSGAFPATGNFPALFMIDGNQGSASGESGWSGAPIEWVARPNGSATDTIPNSYQSLSYPSLDRNGHRLTFSSKDPAFFASANGEYQAFCVTDTGTGCETAPAASAPSVEIGGPVNGASYSGGVAASYNALGATLVTCQWDSETVQSPCPTSPLATKSLADGGHTFSVTASNATGSTTVVSNFTIGSAPAGATITTPAAAAVVTSPVASSYSVSGTPDRVRCWFDSAIWQVTNAQTNFNCPTTIPNASLAAGPHTLNVMTSNAFGSTTVKRSFVVGAPPAVTITNPLEGAVKKNTITATWTVTNSPTTQTCSIDGAAFTTCAGTSKSLGSLSSANGTKHTFAVKATNAAGTSTTTVTFFVTSAQPTVTINSPANGAASVGYPVSPLFTLGGGMPSSVSCQWDAAPAISDCTLGSVANKVLTPGAHTFKVTAVNEVIPAGVTATSSFTVVETAPTVIIDTPSEGDTVTSPASPSFGLGGGTPTSVTCQFDGGPVISSCTDSSIAGTVLAAGAHALTVTASNSAGTSSAVRNFTVQSAGAPPVVTISDPSPGELFATDTVDVSFSATESPTGFTCALDGGAASPCTSSKSYASLDDGPHTVVVAATNGSGSDSASISFTVDTTGPEVAISSPVDATTTGTSVTLDFTATDATTSVTGTTCKLDAAAATSCTTGEVYSGLTPGSHTLLVTATDMAGNDGQASTTFDVAPIPVVTISAPTPGQLSAISSVDVSFSATGSPTGFTCALDGGAASPCTSTKTYTGLADGLHTVVVAASNASGADSESISFTVDTTGPQVAISSPADASNTGTSVTLEFTATDATTSVTGTTCKLDAEAATPCTTGEVYSGLTPGSHTLLVTATDMAGNDGQASTTFTVFAPIPLVTISAPTPGQRFATDAVDVTFAATGSPTGFTCALDGGAPSPCTSSKTYTGLADGLHTIAVAATNASGTGTAGLGFTVDTTGPQVAISSPLNGTTTGTSVTLDFTATDVTSWVTGKTCKLDAAAATPCTTGEVYSGLTPGSHTLLVTATDMAGNDGQASTTFDVAPIPVVTISAPTPGQLSAISSVDVSFSATGSPTGFTCALDGGAASPCTSTKTYTGLADGLHTVVVAASNASGADSESISFTVDTTGPQVAISSPADASNTGTSVTLEFTATDATTSVTGTTCKLDAEAATPCTTGEVYSGLNPGSHTLLVTATDAVGITGQASTTFTVLAPIVAPTVAISTPPDGSTQYSPVGASFTLGGGAPTSVTCQWDSETPITSCTSPIAFHAFPSGTHTLTVTASNSAGTATATSQFTIQSGTYLKVGAVAVIVNFPRNCELLGSDPQLAPYARFKVTNSQIEKAFAGDTAVDTWGELLPDLAALPGNAEGRTTADCRNQRIRRVIRPDASGETTALKAMLATVRPSRGWDSTFAGTTWPRTGTTVLPASAGAVAAAAKVASTQNAIGYADLEAARASSFRKLAESAATINPLAYQYTNTNEVSGFPAINWTYSFRKTLFWVPLESLSAAGTFVEPTAGNADIRSSSRRGSNCPGTPNGDDWSIVNGTSIPAGPYPLCVTAE
ncbi:MAG: hypothetical protein JHD02_02105 [Thermoleophilaceae bacterium]|nr:hypothetical protein [Thermoleophilaceae bacterium]